MRILCISSGFTNSVEDWVEVTTSEYGFLEVALAGSIF